MNGVHYSITEIGSINSCSESLPLITSSGDLTGQLNDNLGGCDGILINGPIHEITILDSVVTGNPNGCAFSIFICPKLVSSISESNEQDVLIYPVPTSDKIIISGLSDMGSEISLIDPLGRPYKIHSAIQGNKVISDVSDFPHGIYFLVANSKGVNTIKKIIIE